MTLAEIQEQMHRLLRGQASPEQTAARVGADARRLAIYQRFVAEHVTGTLESNFTYLRALLGDAWAELAAAYFRAQAPHHWELNAAGEGFPDFVDAERAGGRAGLTPFHVVLAQFEWEEWLAYAHPAAMPVAGELAQPVLNPTLAVLESPYALIDFLHDHRDRLSPALSQPPLLDRPQTILVFRHPVELLANAVVADDDLLLAMKMAAEGIAVDAAAAATGQSVAVIRAALDRAAGCGVIIQPEPGGFA